MELEENRHPYTGEAAFAFEKLSRLLTIFFLATFREHALYTDTISDAGRYWLIIFVGAVITAHLA